MIIRVQQKGWRSMDMLNEVGSNSQYVNTALNIVTTLFIGFQKPSSPRNKNTFFLEKN